MLDYYYLSQIIDFNIFKVTYRCLLQIKSQDLIYWFIQSKLTKNYSFDLLNISFFFVDFKLKS